MKYKIVRKRGVRSTQKILQETLSKFDKQGVGISDLNRKSQVARMRSRGIHNCTQNALGICIQGICIQGTFAPLSTVSTGAVPYPGCLKGGFLHERGETMTLFLSKKKKRAKGSHLIHLKMEM